MPFRAAILHRKAKQLITQRFQPALLPRTQPHGFARQLGRINYIPMRDAQCCEVVVQRVSHDHSALVDDVE